MSNRAVRVVLAVAVVVATSATPHHGAAAVEHDGYSPPVAAPVVDPFRPPGHFGGPGNRGLEYATRRGQLVVASGAGRVAFAGRVGGRSVVSIDHPDGLRTTYSGLGRVDVTMGDRVDRGQPLGTATIGFHFGVRAGDAYLDPARLFEASRGRVRLVPISSVGSR